MNLIKTGKMPLIKKEKRVKIKNPAMLGLHLIWQDVRFKSDDFII